MRSEYSSLDPYEALNLSGALDIYEPRDLFEE
jgi:hypothetical protein